MFKTREIAGWLFVLLGFYLLRMGLEFVGDRKVNEAIVVMFAAMGIFRGGIQLIKVSTAAHVCLMAERRDAVANRE
jgi:hypothetical protein